jgi:Primase C terminal 2 (PriCT-2)/Family of unknown function (DUF5906)/Bifunctional DNA primase/polymerase, N-terminal
MLKYFPVNPTNKQPLVKGWQNYDGEAAGTYGVVLTSDYLIVDIDPRNGGEETENTFELLGFLPETKIVTTASGGRHYYYTKPADIQTHKKINKYAGVDFLSAGAYVVGENSVINGVTYVSNGLPIAEISAELLAEIKVLKKDLTTAQNFQALPLAEISKILAYLPDNYCNEYDKWVTVGMCLHHCSDGAQAGLDIWDVWSQNSKKYRVDLCAEKWHTFKKGRETEVTIGTLLTYAIRHGYDPGSISENLTTLERPKGRDTFDALAELQDWVYVVNVKHFYNIKDRRDFDVDTMRLYYRRTLPKGDTISIILQSKYLTIVDGYTYEPGGPDFVEENGMAYVNRWRGTNIKSVDGDASVFENHLKWMLEDDWVFLRDWMAWCLQKPQRRLGWAVVLTGGQGIGKSYIGEVLSKLIGLENVSYPSNEGIHEKYTTWAARKQLVVVNELMSAGRRDLMNRLKQLITEEFIPVREMYTVEYELKATFNMLIFSNYDSPLVLDVDDRRFCILKSFKVRQPQSYYTKLWDWSYQNLGVIKNYLLNCDLKDFNNHNAPATFAKHLLLQDVNHGDYDRIIDNWAIENKRTIFTLAEISAVLQPELDDFEYIDGKRISLILRKKYQFLKRLRIDGVQHRIYLANTHVHILKDLSNDALTRLLQDEQQGGRELCI